MRKIPLNDAELKTAPGEAITLTTILAVMAIAVVAVVVYQLFKSKNGAVKIPGGWSFTWK
jgi:hypothetical protein